MEISATETTQPRREYLSTQGDHTQQVPLVEEKRTESGVPLVGENDVTALMEAARDRGVAVEMAVILGFLREKPFNLPRPGSHPPATRSSTHPRGSAFLGLTLFRDWIRIPKEYKATWCKPRLVLNDVLKNVQDFLRLNVHDTDHQGTNIVENFPSLTSQGQLTVIDAEDSNHASNSSSDTCDSVPLPSDADEPNSVDSRTSVMESELLLFAGDSEEAQTAVMEALLANVPQGLYIYTGSIHVGYQSLTTQRAPHRVKLPAPDPAQGAPPPYALLFQVINPTRDLRNCVLYPSRDTVEKFINNSHDKEKLLKLENNTKGAYVDKTIVKLSTLLCQKLADINTKLNIITRTEKQIDLFSGIFVSLDKETRNLVLSVPRNVGLYKLEIIEGKIRELVTKEKKALLEEVTSFQYPEEGSDVILKLGAGGRVVNATKDTSLPSGGNLTVMLYACGELRRDFDFSALEDKYGRIERLLEPDPSTIEHHKPYLWGKIHCTSRERFESLLEEHPGAWRGCLPYNMKATWQRPAVPSDGNYLSYLRIPVKRPLQVIDRVVLKKRGASWNPASFPHAEVPIGLRSYRWVGRGRGRRGGCRYVYHPERHRVLWFGDDTGSFKLRGYHNITKKDKLIKEVRSVYGQHVDISFETKPVRRRHYCFPALNHVASVRDNVDASLMSGTHHWIDVKPSLNVSDEYEEISLNFADVSRGADFFSSLQAQNSRENDNDPDATLWKDGLMFAKPLFYLYTMLRPEAFHFIRNSLTSFSEFIKEKKFDVNVNVSRTKSSKMSLTVSGEDRMVVEHVGNLLQDLLKLEFISLAAEGLSMDNEAIFFLNSSGGKCLINNTVGKWGA